MAGAAALVLVLSAGALLRSHIPTGVQAAAPADRDRVAVLPFAYHGDERLSYLGTGMVDLLNARLHGVGGIRVVDATRVAGSRPWLGGQPSPRELARRVGAGRYIAGQVYESGGQLQVAARIHDADGRVRERATAQVSTEADIFDALDELSGQLLRGLAGRSAADATLLAGTTTRSLPALKAFLAGEAALREGRYAAAIAAYDVATTEDTAFALAYYRKAVAADWRSDVSTNEAARAAARALAHELPPHMGRFLEAYEAQFQGDVVGAEATFRSLVSLYPDEPEIWVQLAENTFHMAPLQGRPFTEARHSFERVLALVPGHLDAATHLFRIAVYERRADEADALARVLRRSGQALLVAEADLLLAAAFSDAVAAEELVADVSLDELWVLAHRVAGYTDRLDIAERLFHRGSALNVPVQLRVRALTGLATVQAARGRWADAAATLDRLERAAPVGVLVRGYLASLPHVPVPGDELRRIRRSLVAPPLDSIGFPPRMFRGMPRLLEHVVPYLAGEIDVRLGDLDSARRQAAVLESLLADAPPGSFNPLPVLQARIEQAAGRPADALAIIEAFRRTTHDRRSYPRTVVYSAVQERLLRAALLSELGRDDEALAWYGTMNEDLNLTHAYATAHLARARIHDRRNDRAAARSHYQRVLDLWAGADPALHPILAEARNRLTPDP